MSVKRRNLLTDWGVYKMTSLHDFLDEREQVWADYDNLVYYYGSDIFSGVQNIISGNVLETINLVSNNER